MAPSNNIPFPSPRSRRPSSSPIHQLSSQNLSWYHLISVAFCDTLTERLSRGLPTTPTIAPPESDFEVGKRWSRLCKDKDIASTPFGADDAAGFDLAAHGGLYTDPILIEDNATPPIKESPASITPPAPKRRRGRPSGGAKRQLSPPAAIVAAKKTLRKISDISDGQWGGEVAAETEVARVSAEVRDNDSPPSRRRRSGRSLNKKIESLSTAGDNIVVSQDALPDPEQVTEPEQPPKSPAQDIRAPSPPRLPPLSRKLRKPSTPYHHPTPQIFFYFTTLPAPKKRRSTLSSAPTSIFSFSRFASSSSSSFQPLKRTLTSDKLVMLCMRARVRLQGRLNNKTKDGKPSLSLLPSFTSPKKFGVPTKPWLARNMIVMEKRMIRIRSRKGVRKEKLMGNRHEEAQGNEGSSKPKVSAKEVEDSITDIQDTTNEAEDIEPAVRKRGRKRKRKTV
ncbi:hypothetical protein ABW20_dc0101550 [Dactylellina cionopaga]|nr:hypothetical protein ABW20_dc0101550 [Dactylellina cionopaga]